MNFEWKEIFPALAIVISGYAVIIQKTRQREDDKLNLNGRLVALETSTHFALKALERIEEHALRTLHQPTHFHRDALIDRYRSGQATEAEVVELIKELNEIVTDADSPEEWRQAAILGLATIQSRHEESQHAPNTVRRRSAFRRLLDRFLHTAQSA